jgi:HAMP domain-containing protein
MIVNLHRLGDLAEEMVNGMNSVSLVVKENTAATEEMTTGAGKVAQAIEEIAGISEENSAAAEEVSATVEEVTAQAEEVTASAQSLSEMAQELQVLVAQFRLPADRVYAAEPWGIIASTPSVAAKVVAVGGDGYGQEELPLAASD